MNPPGITSIREIKESPSDTHSADWSTDLTRNRATQTPLHILATSALSLLLGSFSFTATPALEDLERRRKATLVQRTSLYYVARRIISLLEARSMAIQELLQAEAERIRAAEQEAKRGINWTDQDDL